MGFENFTVIVCPACGGERITNIADEDFNYGMDEDISSQEEADMENT